MRKTLYTFSISITLLLSLGWALHAAAPQPQAATSAGSILGTVNWTSVARLIPLATLQERIFLPAIDN